MNISAKVKAVERVFNALDKDVAVFQQKTGFFCEKYCSACCVTPNVEATILEFIPLAYSLNKQHLGDIYFDKISGDEKDTLCPLYSPLSLDRLGWGCSAYPYRGLICRLFGFSARISKNEKKELVTCKTLKQSSAEKIQQINYDINERLKIPIISQYYQKLNNIDLKLSEKTYPIRIAITKALETVLFYSGFRFRKAG